MDTCKQFYIHRYTHIKYERNINMEGAQDLLEIIQVKVIQEAMQTAG